MGNLTVSNDVADDLRGVFVESAFTNDQIDRAVESDVQLGVVESECAFLGDDGATHELPHA